MGFRNWILALLLGLSVHLNAQTDCGTIYISPSGSGILGSAAQPTSLTLALNLYLGDTTRKNFLLLEGNYNLSQRINIPGPIMLDGGYRIVSGEWVKYSDAQTILNIVPGLDVDAVTGVNVGHYIGFAADGKTRFSMKDLTLNVLPGGASGQTSSRGRSVYGVHLNNSSNYYFTRLHITTGDASGGTNGLDGSNGVNGGVGGAGGPGDNDGAACGKGGDGGAGGGGTSIAAGPTSCGAAGVRNNASGWRAGGSGGSGGSGGADDGNGGLDRGGNGSRGGSGGGGILGGLPGTGGNVGDPGNNGTAGVNGLDGINLNGLSYTPGNRPTNYVYGQYFLPGTQSNQGAHGEGGSGGGGGGGGGGQTCFFCDDGSGGGGGGAGGGGEGGEGGFGGFGGGGTFGIYTSNSTVGVTLRDCDIQLGAVGLGGDGGNGGLGGTGGGPGGVSNSGCGEIGCGGNAGTGGKGAGGGRGRDGSNGDTKNVHGITLTGTTVPNPATVIATQYGGCPWSEIQISNNIGGFDLTGTGAQYYPDLGPGQSSYNNIQNSVSIYFTSGGHKDVIQNGTTYIGFLTVRNTRPQPTINAIPPSACLGSPITLGTSQTGMAYEWLIYTTTPSSPIQTYATQNPGNYVPSNLGTYYVRFRIKDECCGWSIPVYDSIAIGTGPVVNLGPDTAACGTYILNAGAGYTNYIWNTSNTQSTQTVLFPGTYSVTVTDGGGCQASDTVNVTLFPGGLTAQAGNDRTICEGENTILGGGPTAYGGTPSYSYTWTGAGVNVPVLANPTATPTATTLYELRVTDANGCVSLDSVQITVRPGVEAMAGQDTMACVCDVVTLGGSPTAQGGTAPYNYIWAPSAGLSGSTTANPTYPACASNTFFLYVTDSTGCTARDTITVTMMDEPAAVYYASIFQSTVNFTDATYGNPTQWYWNFGDGSTSTLQNPSHTYANTGMYTVCLTASNGCGTSTWCDSVNVLIVGNAEPAPMVRFEVYPNPNQGQFEVVWGTDGDRVQTLRVLDLMGKEAYTRHLDDATSEGRMRMELRLPAGIYFVELRAESGARHLRRVVVQ